MKYKLVFAKESGMRFCKQKTNGDFQCISSGTTGGSSVGFVARVRGN